MKREKRTIVFVRPLTVFPTMLVAPLAAAFELLAPNFNTSGGERKIYRDT